MDASSDSTVDGSIDLPDGCRLRRPDPDDLRAIDRLGAACDEAVGATPTLSEDLIRQLWGRPRFALETDAWVVESAGGLVGYGQVWDEDAEHLAAFGLVQPDHTGRGIGSALTALIERRAAEKARGAARLLCAATPQDDAAARLLADRGYVWARRFWHMEVDLDRAPAAPRPPAGIRLRPLDPERDLPAAHRILEEAFRDNWEHTVTSYQEFLDQNVRQDDFDPSLWIVAEDADAHDAVGVLNANAGSDGGWVGELGVLRSHRGLGIASAMLGASFAEFRRRGLPRAGLNVDSDNQSGAVSLYEKMGMAVAGSYDLWARTIRGTQA